LHAAIRLLLPILPALSASSPFADGRNQNFLDYRLETYRTNAARIPSISGAVVPEPVFTHADYDRDIFQRIYADIAPHDPDGVLQDEFLNARGAIARFSRGAIEIRVLDIGECPAADLAVVGAIVAVLQALVNERWSSTTEQQSVPTAPLAEQLRLVARDAERAKITAPGYARLFGINDAAALTANDVWRHLATELKIGEQLEPPSRGALATILEQGPLARRILNATGDSPSRERLADVYRQLCETLAAGEMFVP
jgi:gamma-glutamyl:cysteine ligase YbdK (ATP-grasp superfamily)